MSSVLAIDPNDPKLVRGTPDNDRLVILPGGQAIGGGGDDVFVLTPGFDGFLGTIHDFSPGDVIDVSAFGPRAKLMGQTSPGSQVFAIDFDGDEDADGFLFVFEDHPIPVESDFPIGGPVPDGGPMPVEPDFPIGGPVDLPMPVEPEFPIGGPVEGEVTILPFPISGWDFWIL